MAAWLRTRKALPRRSKGARPTCRLRPRGCGRAAEANDPDAQTRLALLYLRGTGVPSDPARGEMLLRCAAEQGHSPALFELGNLYSRGTAGPADGAEAMRWYRVAAEAGHIEAQTIIARGLSNSSRSAPRCCRRGMVPEGCAPWPYRRSISDRGHVLHRAGRQPRS